jgi:hypothetical protein
VDTEKINWKNLNDTVYYFEKLGYTYVEVPWLVSLEAIQSTFVGECQPALQGKYLIGSGEQGFIELELQGKLPKGKFVTLTPCFRDEQVLNEIKKLHFMKVELYINDFSEYGSGRQVREVIQQCTRNFSNLCNWDTSSDPSYILVNYPKYINTPEGYDLELNNIEIGSYGERHHKDLTWVCATAMAEPRFSYARSLSNPK